MALVYILIYILQVKNNYKYKKKSPVIKSNTYMLRGHLCANNKPYATDSLRRVNRANLPL